MAATRAQTNRAIRQEALREQLSKQKHIEKVVDNINKMEQLDPHDDSAKSQLDILRVANDQRLKLINKYLPDLRTTELTGEGGEAIDMKWSIEVTEVKKAD